jgi:hypothetical protein
MRKEMRREFRDTFILRNSVCDAGHEWGKAEDGEPLLVLQNKPGVGIHTRTLHAGVFREFAGLKTRQHIKVFADKFGDLFNRWTDPPNRYDGTSVLGRPLSTWTEEIGDMRVLVELWDQIKEHDYDALKKLIFLTDAGPEYVISTPKRGRRMVNLTGALTTLSGGPFQFPTNDVLLPARCALQIEINLRLSENRTSPELTWTRDTKETSGGNHQRIVFKPSNLLAAMWVQFAQAVTEELQMRQCEFCGEYFQVGPGAAREDARFCKDVCRVRAWNREKQAAKDERITAQKKTRQSLR